MRPIPQKLPGKGRKTDTINAIIDKLHELELVDSPTVRTEKRPSGTTLHADGAKGGGSGDENVWM